MAKGSTWVCIFCMVLHAFVSADEAIDASVLNRIPTSKEICSLLPPNSTFLQPNTCSNWVKCSPVYEQPHLIDEGSCLNGLYFDKVNAKCNYDYLVECPYTVNNRNPCAHEETGKYLADQTDCNSYIYCRDGKELYAKCPEKMVFNPAGNGECVYSDQYKCEVKNTAHVHPYCRALPDKLPIAHTADCTRYYECVNSELVGENCEKNMAYDHILGKCVDRELVKCYPSSILPEPPVEVCVGPKGPLYGYISDGKTCSGYYYCAKPTDTDAFVADPEPKHYTCPKDQFFDGSSWTCRNRLNVQCDFDRCEGMDDKYVNVPGDCSKYARCQNGVTAFEANCPENYYFDEQTQGCTTKNVNYKACAA